MVGRSSNNCERGSPCRPATCQHHDRMYPEESERDHLGGSAHSNDSRSRPALRGAFGQHETLVCANEHGPSGTDKAAPRGGGGGVPPFARCYKFPGTVGISMEFPRLLPRIRAVGAAGGVQLMLTMTPALPAGFPFPFSFINSSHHKSTTRRDRTVSSPTTLALLLHQGTPPIRPCRLRVVPSPPTTTRRALAAYGVRRFGSRGNMLVLRMFPAARKSITTRSSPTPQPPCGRAPNLKASMYAWLGGVALIGVVEGETRRGGAC